MNLKKKIFILLNMFFLILASEVLAAEKLEAKISNEIGKKNNYIQSIDYNSIDIEFSEFVRRNYTYENKLSLGASVEDISRYDLRDYIDINIRDQKNTMLCWIYSTNSVIEANMKLKNINLDAEFDVMDADKGTTQIYNKLSSAGWGTNYEGGTSLLLLNYYVSGNGPKNLGSQKQEIEIEDFVIFPSIYKEIKNNEIKYYNIDWATGAKTEYNQMQVAKIRNQIKEHIKNYGAVTTSIYSEGLEYYDNQVDIQSAEAFYCDDASKIVDHAVTIIGWDDNYSRENFNSEHRPVNDGAYIVLNSWGKEFSNDGVFYISYDDCFVENLIYGVENSRYN